MEYSQWVKENRATLTTNELWDATNAKLRGHYNACLLIGKCMPDKLNQLSEEPVAGNPHGGFCEESTLLAREE